MEIDRWFSHSYGVNGWLQILEYSFTFNPLRPNSDLSQTSNCNIKGLSVSEV